MSNIAITVENLSKKYVIGELERYYTIRDSLTHILNYPLRLLNKNEIKEQEIEFIWALKDISFEVQHGDIVGIIGRNGAGKSTLLKILSRITSPTKGVVKLNGRVGSLLEVGTGFHPELTGRENIFLNGSILGMSKKEIERKFDEIVDFAEIEKFLDTPVKRYSSGMYVRLAFAVAAHMEPEILIVDEVLAVGDIQFQKKCLGKMDDVSKEGRTVLLVSHNMGVISSLCHNTFLLDKGELIAEGVTSDVVNIYFDNTIISKEKKDFIRNRGLSFKEFRFIDLNICNSDGNIKSQVLLSEGINMEIQYEILKQLRGFNISFSLWNHKGECVFTSTNVDSTPSLINNLHFPGKYITNCCIPREYLRPGAYYIDIGASIPRVRILDEIKSAISINVIDNCSVESKIGQGRLGVISPILEWKTKSMLM